MAKNFYTSDWHAGEEQAPHTHSYLRPQPTEIMIKKWIKECHEKIGPNDNFYFVGDLAIKLTDLEIYRELPKCRKVLILGDKEYNSKHFSKDELLAKVYPDIFDEVVENMTVDIKGITFFVSHKPTDCLEQELPALCGHVHGIWRSAQMPNKQPIINIGIDPWGQLVTDELIAHQHYAITQRYDKNAFPNQW